MLKKYLTSCDFNNNLNIFLFLQYLIVAKHCKLLIYLRNVYHVGFIIILQKLEVGWLLDYAQPLVRTKYATMLLSMHERVLQFVHVKGYTIYFDGLQQEIRDNGTKYNIYSVQKYMLNLHEVVIK